MYNQTISDSLLSIAKNFDYRFNLMFDKVYSFLEYDDDLDKNCDTVEDKVKLIVNYIESTSHYYNSDNILVGYNGIYPFFEATYPYFEPAFEFDVINLSKISSTKAKGLEFGLLEKDNSDFPALCYISLQHRNCENVILFFIAE